MKDMDTFGMVLTKIDTNKTLEDLLIFSRIPKTGSENFAFIIERLAKVI